MKQSPPGTAEPQLRIDAPNTQDAPNKEALAQENARREGNVKAELGLRGPREEFDSSLSGMTLTFRASEAYLALIRRPEAGQSPPAASEVTGEKTREKVLRLLINQPEITSAELATELGITEKDVEWQLGRLKAAGQIQRSGPDKGGRWEVLP